MDAFLESVRSVSPWIVAPVVFAVWVVALLLVKRLIFSRIRALAARSQSKIDDVLVYSISRPATFLIIGSGILFVARILPFPPEVDRGFGIAFGVLVLLAVVLFLDRLARGLADFYAPRVEFLRSSRPILVGATRAFIILIALIIFLGSVGVSITPLVASLGIGSLAVALALQDTLANFFAGIQVLIDKPVTVGDFVRLDSGEEGYVTKVGWRSTQVRMISDDVVVVPNSKLISSVIRNYSLPRNELVVRVQVGVHYDSDLEHVEKVACEVGKAVMQNVKGGIPEFEPFVRYHTFGDSSINFTMILRAKTFEDGYRVKHEFVKMLRRRFREEGIVIPFPIRTLDISKDDLTAIAGREPE
jgi:small-conductance mechanosensitive channel